MSTPSRLRLLERVAATLSTASAVASQAHFWLERCRGGDDHRVAEARRLLTQARSSLSIAYSLLTAAADDEAEGLYTAHCGHRFPLGAAPTCDCGPAPT